MQPIYETKSEDLYAFDTHSLTFPPHLHAYLELVYVQRGEINVHVQSWEGTLQSGDFAVIFPNMIHSYHTHTTDAEQNCFIIAICHLGLTGDYMNTLIQQRPRTPLIARQGLHSDVSYAMESLLAQRKEKPNPPICKAFIQLILARVLPHVELEKHSEPQDIDLTSRMIAHISHNFERKLSLDTLAKELGVSKYHLSRVFSRKLHTSFSGYVNSLRINAAQNLLRNTDQSIIKICYDCGFDSQRTFNRVFHANCGMSPRMYRDISYELAQNK